MERDLHPSCAPLSHPFLDLPFLCSTFLYSICAFLSRLRVDTIYGTSCFRPDRTSNRHISLTHPILRFPVVYIPTIRSLGAESISAEDLTDSSRHEANSRYQAVGPMGDT